MHRKWRGQDDSADAIRPALLPFIRGFDASLYVKDKSLAIRTEDVRLVFRPEALNMEMSPAMITYRGMGKWKKRQPGCSTSEENSRRAEDKTVRSSYPLKQLQTLVHT